MDQLFGGQYKGKTVLVTGHTGFKGSWLSLWLSRLGARVIGYSLPAPTQPNHIELLQLPIVSLVGDILDKAHLARVMREYQPEIVFHLAAQPLVRDSYERPVETFETNILGTVNVLEVCRKSGSVRAIVNITSDKCYQNNEWTRPYREDDAMGGYDPYSASKGAAELVASAYRNSFFNLADYGVKHQVLLASVRAGNVIGGGDWAKDRLIPDIMRATSRGETVTIRNPRATRPWQHVLEPLSGYLAIGQRLLEGKKEFAEGWNFGPDAASSLTVEQVIAHVKMQWNAVRIEVKVDPNQPHEAKLLALDSTKAHERLGWKPVWGGEHTFEKTVNWYKAYYQQSVVLSEQDLVAYVTGAREAEIAWAVAETEISELLTV